MTSIPATARHAISATQTTSHSESNSHLDAALRISSAEQRTQPVARDVLKRVLITIAGLAGVIAILVTIAPFFGWTVVRLATGSMAPVYPTDSLLITHSIPAADAHVGEIVMVQRPGELPITHRVVSATAEANGIEKLRLKGDDNNTADAAPYLVSTVGLVVAGVPWGGQIFAALRSTVGLAGLTVFATFIVLWAWWPTGTKKRRAHAASTHDASAPVAPRGA
jgi:signal peptidase